MSDACGTFEVAAFGWHWNDEAPAPMPDGNGANVCSATSHRPTDHEPGDAWPVPAPPGPYTTSLSGFDLTDPNGDWRLFVNDDSSEEVGFFTNRFRLVLSLRPKANVAFAKPDAMVGEGERRELSLTRTGPATLGAGSVTVTSVPVTATSGSDFTALSVVVDFAPGETRKTILVDALDDPEHEPDEAYAVSIGSPTGDATAAAPSSVTVTIPAPPAGGGGPGDPGGGPGGGGEPGASDATAPSFIGPARAVPRTFAVGPARRTARAVQGARRKLKRGTTFRYALAEDARVVFAIERKREGRRVGKQCSKPTRANRGKRRCTRYVRTGAFLAPQRASAGRNRKRFSGHIAGRRLSPGGYRATLVATDTAKNASKPVRAAFRVVKP